MKPVIQSPRPFTPVELVLPVVALIGILVPSALVWHIPFFWSLATGWLVTILIARRAGYPAKRLATASWDGLRDTLLVITVIGIIGALMAVWFQSATIPALVYHSLKVAVPQYLPVWGFVATSVTSLLLGSAIGTIGTVGVTLVGVGQALEVSAPLLAGALVSGAFVGDRTSLVSSIFQMLAQATKVPPLLLFRVLLKTGIPAILLCLVAYAATGWYTYAVPELGDDAARVARSVELLAVESDTSVAARTSQAIGEHYQIDGWALVPAVVMLTLAVLRLRILWCLLASVGAAILVALFVQGTSVAAVVQALLLGYPGIPESAELAGLKGGGVWGTRDVLTLLVAAGALNGVLTHCGMLRQLLQHTLTRIKGSFALVCFSGILSVLMGAITCTQTLTILLPGPLLRPLYHERGLADELLARTLGDTGLVAIGLVPWSLLSLIFTTALAVPAQTYAPYAFFLWILPLMTLGLTLKEGRRLTSSNVADVSDATDTTDVADAPSHAPTVGPTTS